MGEPIAEVGSLAGLCGHDGTDWIKVLVDSDGKLQIEVDTSALPTGAATAENQITMITALQLIDDLRNALDSVGTDELDVNVEAFDPVPTNPVGDSPIAISVATSTWVDIGSLTVSTGKTLYLTDFFISDGSSSAGVEFYYRVYADGAIQISGHMGAGFGVAEHMSTPIKATSGNEVAIHVYQWSGAARWYQAGFVGFEV
jgi:hypothetical protein